MQAGQARCGSEGLVALLPDGNKIFTAMATLASKCYWCPQVPAFEVRPLMLGTHNWVPTRQLQVVSYVTASGIRMC